MGTTSLETVLRCLQEAGFPADTAYPGQKLPQITEAVAAFHIHEINSSKQAETIEVSILCPAHMGGAACEEAALRATAALQAAGASCIQKGCQYETLAQLYRVAVFATFTQAPEEESSEPGFQIRLDGVSHPWAVAFSAEKIQDQTPEFATRSPEAVAITSGSHYWKICLEERIPYGSQESGEAPEDFALRVTRDARAEIYSPCRWSSVTRSFTAEGLRLICRGIALTRKEVSA